VIWTEGDRTQCFCFLLSGESTCVESNGKLKLVLDVASRGEFVGQNEYFLFREGEVSVHKSTLTLTGPSNMVMICSYKRLARLVEHNHLCGIRLVRLLAEACCSTICAPRGTHKQLLTYPVEDVNEVREMLHNLTNTTLVRDMAAEELDKLLSVARIAHFSKGMRVFNAGHQTKLVLMLLTGSLEVRYASGTAYTFSEPGDTIGESIIPNITHKGDTFGVEPGTLLAFSLETIHDLTIKCPKTAFKLIKNIIRSTLDKMNRVYKPHGQHVDPEKVDISATERELAELRQVATRGLQGLLSNAMHAMTGHSAEVIQKEVVELSLENMVLKLAKLQDTMVETIKKAKIPVKNESAVGTTTLNREIDKHKIRIEQLRQVEVDLNAQIVAKNEEIEALQDSFDKERKRFELERFALTQHIDKIGEELKEEKSRASEAVDKSAKMKDSLNEQGAQMRKLRGQLEESLKGGKDAMEVSEWKDMVSYLRKENDEKDVRVEKLSTLVKKLQAYLHELEEKNNALANALDEREALALDDEDEFAVLDDTIPRLEGKIQEERARKVVWQWGSMLRQMAKRSFQKQLLREMVELMRENRRNMDTRNSAMKTISEYSEECKLLRRQIKDHQHSMKEAELEFDNRYQAAQSEMAKTFAMTLETGSVCCWMVATMIELEASLYKPPAPWPVQELKRILAVWKLLGERGKLPDKVKGLDIGKLLASRLEHRDKNNALTAKFLEYASPNSPAAAMGLSATQGRARHSMYHQDDKSSEMVKRKGKSIHESNDALSAGLAKGHLASRLSNNGRASVHSSLDSRLATQSPLREGVPRKPDGAHPGMDRGSSSSDPFETHEQEISHPGAISGAQTRQHETHTASSLVGSKAAQPSSLNRVKSQGRVARSSDPGRQALAPTAQSRSNPSVDDEDDSRPFARPGDSDWSTTARRAPGSTLNPHLRRSGGSSLAPSRDAALSRAGIGRNPGIGHVNRQQQQRSSMYATPDTSRFPQVPNRDSASRDGGNSREELRELSLQKTKSFADKDDRVDSAAGPASRSNPFPRIAAIIG